MRLKAYYEPGAGSKHKVQTTRAWALSSRNPQSGVKDGYKITIIEIIKIKITDTFVLVIIVMNNEQ